MADKKVTKLSIRDDRPTAIASSVYGANVDAALGFNLLFIAAHKPKVAVELLRLYTEAHKIQQDDPAAPDEDFELFNEELVKLQRDSTEEL